MRRVGWVAERRLLYDPYNISAEELVRMLVDVKEPDRSQWMQWWGHIQAGRYMQQKPRYVQIKHVLGFINPF